MIEGATAIPPVLSDSKTLSHGHSSRNLHGALIWGRFSDDVCEFCSDVRTARLVKASELSMIPAGRLMTT